MSEHRFPSLGETSWAPVAEAFGHKALEYDGFGENHPNLQRLRARVRTLTAGWLPPGGRLLEINAGTGADAAHFAGLGYRVHATDLSPGMVASIRAKIDANGFGGRLTAQQLSFTDLDWAEGAPYDGLLSNLGGLNCTSSLRAVTRHLPRVLRPGGVVIWVVMPPVCPWELAQALRGDLRLAFRRLRPGGVQANVAGVSVPTFYYTPRQLRAACGAAFRPLHLEGLSVFAPPADHKEFALQHPRLYRFLVGLDERLAQRPPFSGWGDFFLLALRYLPGEQRER